MSDSSADDSPKSAAVLESMTLLATLSTAAEVRNHVHDRRTGRDPAAQTPTDVATARLHNVREELMDVLMGLLLGQAAAAPPEGPDLAEAVRHFDLLLKLRRVERLTKTMHQHLLSLYPNVSEELVEEARSVHDQFEALLHAGASAFSSSALAEVTEQGVSLAVWTRHET